MVVPASAYNANIPQATDRLSVSQSDLLNNFGAIQSLIDTNHADFGDANGNPGKHLFVEMPVTGGSSPYPLPSTAANEVGLYCAVGSIMAVPSLFFQKQSAATPIEVSSYFYNGTDGGFQMINGISVRFGQGTITPGTTKTVTYPTPFPGGSTVFIPIVSNQSTGVAAIMSGTANINNIQLKTSISGNTYAYVVIGF